MKSIFAALASFALASTALADAPAGAAGLPCDITQFTPVIGDDGVTVLYWNNPTCVHIPSESCERDNSCDLDE